MNTWYKYAQSDPILSITSVPLGDSGDFTKTITATVAGQKVGTLIYDTRVSPDSVPLYLYSIHVNEDFRRQGIGTKMVHRLCQEEGVSPEEICWGSTNKDSAALRESI